MNSYVFIKDVGVYNFKGKDSAINAAPLCLGNASKDFSVDNLKKTGLYKSFSWFGSIDFKLDNNSPI